MAISKDKKDILVADLSEKLSGSKAVVFTDFRGLTVEELEEVRNKLRSEGISFKVVKNTLFHIAAKNAGLELSEDATQGHPVAVAFSTTDEVAAAKIANDFAKKNDKFAIIGGILEGKQISDIAVKSLANMPSREQLYAQLVGTIASPLSGMVNVLSGNLRGLVTILNAIKETK